MRLNDEPKQAPQLGAPDPELRNSPILDDQEPNPFDLQLETGGCYFNDLRYPLGQYVRSGDELLHCEGAGVWVRKAEGVY